MMKTLLIFFLVFMFSCSSKPDVIMKSYNSDFKRATLLSKVTPNSGAAYRAYDILGEVEITGLYSFSHVFVLGEDKRSSLFTAYVDPMTYEMLETRAREQYDDFDAIVDIEIEEKNNWSFWTILFISQHRMRSYYTTKAKVIKYRL